MGNDYNSYSEYKKSVNLENSRNSKPKQKTKTIQEQKVNQKANSKPKPKSKSKSKRSMQSKPKNQKEVPQKVKKTRKKVSIKTLLKNKKEALSEFTTNAKKSSRNVFVALLLGFYVFIAFQIIHNDSLISEKQVLIDDLKIQIDKETNINNELQVKRESTYKSETIENIAKYRLGMIYPTKDQIVYINID